MFILGNLIITTAKLLDTILFVVNLLIIIRALVSWVSPDPFNPLVQFLYRTTDPILDPIQRRLPVMAIDISPVIAFLVIYFLRSFLVVTLIEIGYRMQ